LGLEGGARDLAAIALNIDGCGFRGAPHRLPLGGDREPTGAPERGGGPWGSRAPVPHAIRRIDHEVEADAMGNAHAPVGSATGAQHNDPDWHEAHPSTGLHVGTKQQLYGTTGWNAPEGLDGVLGCKARRRARRAHDPYVIRGTQSVVCPFLTYVTRCLPRTPANSS
jgi:hypothetical protein